MTNSPACCACVALDCIIKDIAKKVTAAKQVLTVTGDLRPGRARKRDPMVSSFAMEKVAGRPATSQSIPPRQESSSPVRASVCSLLCPRQHFRFGECDATVAPPGQRPALFGQ